MTKPAVHQVLATLGYGDAIGHEVLGIQRALRSAGYESDIFVETADPRLEDQIWDYRDLMAASHPDNLLLHHFSIGSKASRVAFALPDRMTLIYHNITPPEYFVGVHDLLVELCYLGRRELRAYVDRCEIAVGDSEFNRQELAAIGFADTGVLPVVPDFSHLDVTRDSFIASDFDDAWTNIVFVGRVIPNKRIEDLIRIFAAYKRAYNHRSRLIVVGSQGGFEKYVTMLYGLAARLGVTDLHMTDHVTNAQLAACYDVADVFLCASEHEGFCVPLMEAFHARVPVIAYAATAVPATMDGGGILYRGSRPDVRRRDHRCCRVRCGAGRSCGRVSGCGARAAPEQGFRRYASGHRRPRVDGGETRTGSSGVRFLGSIHGIRAAEGSATVPARDFQGATVRSGRQESSRGRQLPTPNSQLPRRTPQGRRLFVNRHAAIVNS